MECVNAPNTQGGRKAVTVRLDPDTYGRLVRLATTESRTVSATASNLLREALDARAAK